MAFSIHDIYRQVFKFWRQKRFKLFIELLSPRREQCLLDVGGYPEFWMNATVALENIDTLNVHPVAWKNFHSRRNIRTFVGDGCALPFPDKSYDIAFSNSVIEHVGDWERQEVFAREIRRVGNAIWVQTPAFACPIEPHYLAPFVHWLPKKIQRKIIRWLTPRGWLQKPTAAEIDEMVETTRLLTKKEMKKLFPDCEIYTERLAGILPKSYVAYRK